MQKEKNMAKEQKHSEDFERKFKSFTKILQEKGRWKQHKVIYEQKYDRIT